jgi:hypothetical protein
LPLASSGAGLPSITVAALRFFLAPTSTGHLPTIDEPPPRDWAFSGDGAGHQIQGGIEGLPTGLRVCEIAH